MAPHKDRNRRIQVLTFLEALPGKSGDMLEMLLSGQHLWSSPEKEDTKQKLRIGRALEENPKLPRNEVRSGTSEVVLPPQSVSTAARIKNRRDNWSTSGSPGFVFHSSGNSRQAVKSLPFLLVCFVGVFWGVSCGGSGGGSPSKNPGTITVNITPTTAIVGLGGTMQFTCDESGNANTNVIWEVDSVVGGNSTVGTISSKGLYTAPDKFSTPTTVTVTCIAQANGTSAANVPVTLSSGVTVSVSPASADLQFGKTQQFTAAVSGSSITDVTWQAGGVTGGNSTYGTISSGGLYTGPSTATATPMSVTVSAVAQVDTSKSGTASVIVHGGIGVAVNPGPVTLATFGTQQFAATVTGTSNKGITWEVNGVVGGSIKTGTISTGGLYSAPNSVPTTSSNSKSVAASVTVTAVSQADSTARGNVMVTIQPPNQGKQITPISLGGSGGNANDNGNAGGSAACCGGTLGALVSRGGNQYILSASHVLARSDAGSLGDAIIQPGLIDSSCSTASTTTVANLAQFVNLENPSTTGLVDAALAKVIPGQVDLSGTILQLGSATNNGQSTDAPPHAGTGVAPSLGLPVAKSGRSTGLTCSTVTAINAVVNVQYQKGCGAGSSFATTFSDLVIVGDPSFSADGDSGSLLVTQSSADPVALLVASSDTDSVATPVSSVLAGLADPSTSEQPVFVGASSTHPVAGCSLPGPQSSSASATSQVKATPTTEKLQAATAVLDGHAAALLRYPQVRALGIGPSRDEPGQAAILLVIPNGASSTGLPTEVEGQRTRVIRIDDIPHEGVLSAAESRALIDMAGSSTSVTTLTDKEFARARKVQSSRVTELLKKEGIQGVAITSSADNPGEAALLLLVIRESTHDTIPPVLDGLRTRIQESTAFKSGARSANPNGGCRVQPTNQSQNEKGADEKGR